MIADRYEPPEMRNQSGLQLSAEPHDVAPEILYHYTSTEAFLSILRTGEFRAKNVRFMRDQIEWNYGFKLLCDTLSAMFPELTENSVWDLTQELFMHGVYEERLVPPVFVCCFSEAADDAGQWERYADQGRGVAIGLLSHHLLGEFRSNATYGSRPPVEAALRRVVYDQDVQKSMLRTALLPLAGTIKPIVERRGHDSQDQDAAQISVLNNRFKVFEQVQQHVFTLLAQFKHPGFATEREWRLVLIEGEFDDASREHDLYMAGPHGIEAYRTLSFDVPAWAPPEYEDHLPYAPVEGTLPIRTLILGPGQQSLEALASARMFLRAQGYDSVIGEIGIGGDVTANFRRGHYWVDIKRSTLSAPANPAAVRANASSDFT